MNPDANALQVFYKDVVDCLTEPKQFFTVRYPQISLTYALTFAVVVNWISDTLAWLTRIVRHETLMDGFLKMRDRLSLLPFWKDIPPTLWAQPDHSSMLPPWLVEALGIALSPFQSLIHVVLTGLFIGVGAYLLVPKHVIQSHAHNVAHEAKDNVEIAGAIKIVALCSAPHLIGSILGFLPLGLGSLISGIYVLVLLIFALSIRYQISYLRSFATVILPGILLMVVGGCVLLTFGAVLVGMADTFFGASS